jgi:tol-pal system-associated acyl-CoA thioesterase
MSGDAAMRDPETTGSRLNDSVSEADFTWPCRVYYEDTDGQGFLYHSRCLNFFERARTEWVRSFGVTQSEWLAKGLGFVVSSATLKYLQPAFLDDALLATVCVGKVGRSRICLTQQLLKSQGAAANRSCIVMGEFTIAFVDLTRQKPVAMPPQMAEALRRDSSVE